MTEIVELVWNKDPTQIVDEKTRGIRGMLWLGNEFRKFMDDYVPQDSKTLKQNVQVVPSQDNVEVIYKSPYAHYQYEGIIFVDPKYNVGGFTNGDGLFWSRPGVTKKSSGKKMNHPNGGQSHWDEPVRATKLPALVAAYQKYIGG